MRTRLFRWAMNLYPAFRGTGGRITHIAADWTQVIVKIPLNWRTRNYVGTTFGGSMYGAVDPFYMIMLIKALGPEFVVWDKAAQIQFDKPGRVALYATFTLSDDELHGIRRELQSSPKIDRHYTVELKDRDGVVHATVQKVIHIRKKAGAR